MSIKIEENATLEEICFSIIAYAGDARSQAMEAINVAKKNEINQAKQMLDEALNTIQDVHRLNASLIQQEAGGKPTLLSLLLIHAQDHFMIANATIELANHFIELYARSTPTI